MEATSIQNQNQHAVFPIFLWGFILFCFFGLLAIAAVRWFGNFQSYDEQRALERVRVYAEYRELMNTNLNTLKWADDQKQAAQIPLADAMKITVKRLNSKRVSASAVTIAPPASVSSGASPVVSEGAAPQTPAAQGAAAASSAPVDLPEPTPSDAATDSTDSEVPVSTPTSSPALTGDSASGAHEAPQQTTQE